jgi:hypothetical protein
MKKFTIFFLLFTTSLSAQMEYAPYGAFWKYTLHRFIVDYPYNCEFNICDQGKQRLEVIDTVTIQGKSVSVLQQFWGDSDTSGEPLIYVHANNDSVYFYAQNDFHLLYDFTAKDGDTININVPNFYNGPGSLNATPFQGVDSIYNIDVIEKDRDSVMVSGEMRRVAEYNSFENNSAFTLPRIIDNIGSGSAYFGFNGGFVAEGCYGFFICYEDSNQVYTPFGCCEFPADYPKRKFAPEGAEWLYEGWSEGGPNEDGCDNSCKGNYNR